MASGGKERRRHALRGSDHRDTLATETWFSHAPAMKRVFSAETLPVVAHIKNLLEAEGIECVLKNENIGSVMGEVPFFEIWPEVWVRDDLDVERANAVIERHHNEAAVEGPRWACRHCGADNDPQFGACWQCSEPADQ